MHTKLLFIESHQTPFIYFCSIFSSKELSEGKHTVKTVPDIMSILKEMADYKPGKF